MVELNFQLKNLKRKAVNLEMILTIHERSARGSRKLMLTQHPTPETMRVEEIKTSKKELQKLISLRLLSEIFKKRSRKHLLAYQIRVASLKHPKTVVQNVMTEHTVVNKSRLLRKWQKVF